MGDQKKSIIVEFLVFNAIGILNTVLAYLLFALLIYAGVHYFPALVADYVFGGVFSFVMNKRYTFAHDGPVMPVMVKRMLLLIIMLFLLNLVLLYFMVDLMKLNELVAQLIALGFIAISSYSYQKYRIFGQPQ